MVQRAVPLGNIIGIDASTRFISLSDASGAGGGHLPGFFNGAVAAAAAGSREP